MNAVPRGAPLTAHRPLLDVLGARWRVGVPAAAVAWDVATGLAGFALSDGTLALVHPVWEGAPTLRPRAGGGAELIPGTAPAPPAARAKAHQGACLSVAPDPDGGFLSGGSDGRVVRIKADGATWATAHLDGPVTLVAAGPGHWRACAVRQTVHRLGGAASSIDVGTQVSALALDPSGARLAIGHVGGVTLWAGGDAPRVLTAPGKHSGLSWTADRTFLASMTPEGVLHAWKMPDEAYASIDAGVSVTALDALAPAVGKAGAADGAREDAQRDADGDAAAAGFVAGAAGRVLCWHLPENELTTCGVPNRAVVTRVASHPHRRLVAAGYDNGTVVLCQPDSPALLLLRAAGEGAVSALAFSPFGGCLAIGTNGGDVGVLALPNMLFRDQVGRQ